MGSLSAGALEALQQGQQVQYPLYLQLRGARAGAWAPRSAPHDAAAGGWHHARARESAPGGGFGQPGRCVACVRGPRGERGQFAGRAALAEVKHLAGKNGAAKRFRLIVSDGQRYCNMMLATTAAEEVEKNPDAYAPWSILELHEIIGNEVMGRRCARGSRASCVSRSRLSGTTQRGQLRLCLCQEQGRAPGGGA